MLTCNEIQDNKFAKYIYIYIEGGRGDTYRCIVRRDEKRNKYL